MKKFEIITETDARVLARGETVTLARGGHITPLAQDTLKERRITVVRDGQASADGAALVPRADIRSMAIASDHTGIKLPQLLTTFLRGRGLAEKRGQQLDRKSTRLNSSHGYISYAVFCLKKKKTKRNTTVRL